MNRTVPALAACLSASSFFALALTHCGSSSGGETPGKDASPPGHDAATVDAGVHDAGGDAAEAAIPCDSTHACPGSMTCCGGFCSDVHLDPRNCGACGISCTATQFCTGTACTDAVFKNLCANGAATVVEDAFSVDNAAGAAMGAALGSSCNPAPKVVNVPQSMSGVLEPVGDAGARPNTGVGNTLVAGGSYFGQLGVSYMDQAGISPVYLVNDGTTARFVERLTGSPVVTASDSALTEHHDFFYVEMAVEPQSGTLAFVGAGIMGPGTQAAGYFISSEIIPNRGNYGSSWYAYEWTDKNNDGVGNAGDTFTVVAQAP